MSDLSQIRFLVLDEADRMVQKHCFPQLVQILESVHSANPGSEQEEDDDDTDESDDEDAEDYLSSLPGVRGESKVTMLTDDILRQMESLQGHEPPEIKEVPDEEFEEAQSSVDAYDELEDTDFSPEHPRVHRQTFIYSATLTMPQTETKVKTNSKKKGRRQDVSLDGPIADILSKTRAMGETKIVDLSMLNQDKHSSQSGGGAGRPNGVQLPPGLHLELVKCTQRHKDSHLYAYLVTTAQGASGPCLVFCNSIAGVRRVGTTLQKLGLPVRILHAHMQQVRF
jgi:ATP-dependent RNA helicase DDX24/MAK5